VTTEAADTTPGQSVWAALNALRDAEVQQRKQVSAMTGLSDNDQEALRLIVDAELNGTPLGPKDLARGLALSSASVTVLMDRLEKRGLARRASNSADRRALLVVPTDTGIALSKAVNATSAGHTEVLGTVTADEAAVITGFLGRLSEAIYDAPIPED